jgi:hypothetical protein
MSDKWWRKDLQQDVPAPQVRAVPMPEWEEQPAAPPQASHLVRLVTGEERVITLEPAIWVVGSSPGERAIAVHPVSWFDPRPTHRTQYGAAAYIAIFGGDGGSYTMLLAPEWVREEIHEQVLHGILACTGGREFPDQLATYGVREVQRYQGKFWYGSGEYLTRQRARGSEVAIKTIRAHPEAFFAALDEQDELATA